MAGCLRFLRKPINSKKSIYHGEAKNALSIGRLDLNTIFVNHKGQLGQIQPSPSISQNIYADDQNPSEFSFELGACDC